jgi:hypothetical protein
LDHIHMADSIGIGWRNESYLGGAFDHIRVAACVGILIRLINENEIDRESHIFKHGTEEEIIHLFAYIVLTLPFSIKK